MCSTPQSSASFAVSTALIVCVKARANLHRQRYRDRFLDSFENLLEPAVVLQQSGTTTVLHNLRRGTAAIYVENIGAHFLRHLRRHAHALRLAAKDLHRKRPLILVKPHLPF
jgi:hypothetical protein